MKIAPLYTLRQELAEEHGSIPREFRGAGRKAMVLDVRGDAKVFPVGTPDHLVIDGVKLVVYRGKVNHFHTTASGCVVPHGWDLDGFVLARSKRLGKGRRVLRKFLAMYPPIDQTTQAFRLRQMVRPGD